MHASNPQRRLARSITATTLAALALGAAAHDQESNRHRLPRLSPAQPGVLHGTCEELAARLAGLPNTVIAASTTVAAGTLAVAGQPIAEHCRITGKMHERVSPVDGKTYSIQFEMRLPKNWNGRFFHQGNGGIDGAVVTANTSFGGGALTSTLLQGFAVLSSDAGHSNAQGGPAFGLDPQARLDYGYQAVGKLTPMAKQAIAVAYGKAPDRSYFGGCSNGGRHTLVTAARYAHEYDGYLAGAPGYNLPLAALANIFGGQRYASLVTAPANPATPPGLETAFTTAERKTVANAVLARCDALDGATDGLVQDTRACQRKFDFMRDVPTCAGARDGSCLTQAQKIAIAPIFSGATTANGQHFYAPFPFDSGIGAGGIPFWEFTAPLVLDSGAVGAIFKVPPSPLALSNGPAFSLGLNIDSALAELFATDATYTESAMSFATPPDATDMNDVRRPRRQDPRLSRCQRSDLLGGRHRALVPRHRSLQRRPRRRFRALVPGARHGPLLRRPGHRPGRLHHATGGMGRARPRARCDRRRCARRRQRGRCQRRSAGRLGARPHAAAVPVSAGGTLRRPRQRRERQQLGVPQVVSGPTPRSCHPRTPRPRLT